MQHVANLLKNTAKNLQCWSQHLQLVLQWTADVLNYFKSRLKHELSNQ